jgi:hypothetical protein
MSPCDAAWFRPATTRELTRATWRWRLPGVALSVALVATQSPSQASVEFTPQRTYDVKAVLQLPSDARVAGFDAQGDRLAYLISNSGAKGRRITLLDSRGNHLQDIELDPDLRYIPALRFADAASFVVAHFRAGAGATQIPVPILRRYSLHLSGHFKTGQLWSLQNRPVEQHSERP